MEILDLVLQGLEIQEPTPKIERAVESVGQFIREYCGLEEIPKAVYPLWGDMVCYLLKGAADGGPDFTGLTSVSMGDVAYSFNNGEFLGVQPLLADYRHRLNKVRKGLFR